MIMKKWLRYRIGLPKLVSFMPKWKGYRKGLRFVHPKNTSTWHWRHAWWLLDLLVGHLFTWRMAVFLRNLDVRNAYLVHVPCCCWFVLVKCLPLNALRAYCRLHCRDAWASRLCEPRCIQRQVFNSCLIKQVLSKVEKNVGVGRGFFSFFFQTLSEKIRR